MLSQRRSHRRSATIRQNNLCFYCEWPMWNGEEGSLATFQAVYQFTRRQAEKLACTAEHLLPVKDGGEDTAKNIVAACDVCNQRRHHRHAQLDAEKYKALVKERVAKGRWHSASFCKVIGRQAKQERVVTSSKSSAAKAPRVLRDRLGSGASAPAPA